jgi:hypothetical protein
MVRHLGHVMYASVMTQLEVISALPRKVREGHLDHDRALMLSRRVSTHFADRYALVAITPQVMTHACELL